MEALGTGNKTALSMQSSEEILNKILFEHRDKAMGGREGAQGSN